MKAKLFPPNILAAIRREKILGIRAGTEPHRIIGIWAVVVEGRVFVRSWSLKPRSWYRTFLEDPSGVIQVGKRRIRIRAIQTRSERLKDAVSEAYREKYNTPGSIKFVQDMSRTTATGLTYIVTRNTQGRQPQAGETVLVNYTGLLGSGVKFDSSLDRGQPFEFPLGRGRVIKGWDEGIGKLRVGEQATLIIPAQLGYGDRGAGGVIPPNSTLIFLVELVGIKETPKTNP